MLFTSEILNKDSSLSLNKKRMPHVKLCGCCKPVISSRTLNAATLVSMARVNL
jgi:hypothetical protein